MKKLTKKDMIEMHKFNTLRVKIGEYKLTEEQYLNYIYGKGLPNKQAKNKTIYKGLDIPCWANSTKHIPSLTTDHIALKKDDSYKKEISKNYTVAIAYNKGGYQVLRNEEIMTAGRKV